MVRRHREACDSSGCVEGFSVLRFGWEAGEVVEQPGAAEVLRVGTSLVECGDFGGMPVTRADGVSAERVGTNSSLVTEKLRELAFSAETAGPGHVRWPEEIARPRTGPFGVVVLARQSVRSEQGTFAELDLDLHVSIVGKDGVRERVTAGRGELVRALLRATVRRDVDADLSLVTAVQAAESALVGELRRPTDAEREARVAHAVWPIVAVTVA